MAAHEHVAECPHSPSPGDVFGAIEDFPKAQHTRRSRLVLEYLATLDAKIRQRVLDACRPSLDSLELDLVLP